MDSDTNGTPSQLDVAGQYSTNALAVSNRVTGINLTMAEDSDSDGLPDWWELANFGTLAYGPDDDPDGDTLSNATELELHTEGGSPNVVSSDVVLETRSVASKRYLPYEGVQGFQQGGTYYQDIAIAASAAWNTHDCMSATTRVGQITANVSTHFVTLTNCESIWSGSGDLSAQDTVGSYDTNVPSSSKRNEWTWSNCGVWNSPGTPWQLGVAGTTIFFACNGAASPSNCAAAATNAPCEPPLILLSGTTTMVTNTVDDTLQQWLWDGDYTPGCTGEVIRSNQAHGPLAITLSTPITIEDLIDEVLSDVQNTNYWQSSGWTNGAATPRWVHECPDQDLGCPESDSIAAYYVNTLSAGAKRGQFRITVPSSTSGVVYRAVALWQRMSDGVIFDSKEYTQVSTGGTLYLTSGEGVFVEPPGTADCVRVVVPIVNIGVDESDSASWELDEAGGRDQIATVKGAGTVTLKVTIDPDSQAIIDAISWQGAIEDGSDPTLATVVRSNSVRHTVSVRIGGKTAGVADVWVIWGSIDQLITSDPPGTPTDSAVSPTGLTNAYPTAYGCAGMYQSTDGVFRAHNGILLRGTLTPPGVASLGDGVEYKFKRTKEKCGWSHTGAGWARFGAYEPPLTDDGPYTCTPDACSQDVSPSSADHIYDADIPGTPMLELWDEGVHRANFVEHIEVNIAAAGWQDCSEPVDWHSTTWAIRRGWPYNDCVRRSTENSIGSGQITVGSGEAPPVP